MEADLTGYVVRFLAWSYLPNLITGILHSIYYKVTVSAGRRPPQPGQPEWQKHRRRINVLILCLYLVYTVAQSLYDIRLQGDFYRDLGIATDASEKEIKKRFRRLAAQHHPDKVQGNGQDMDFVHLRLAQDTLIEPAKRYAYDRFGSRILSERHEKLVTIREYVYEGLKTMSPVYIGDGLMLVLTNYLILSKWGRFWRYFAVAALALLELYLLTHSWSPPPWLCTTVSLIHRGLPDLLPPHILPFQLLEVARKLSMSLNIFISRLAPPEAQQKGKDTFISPQQEQQIQQNAALAIAMDAEATGLLTLGLTPFRQDPERVKLLRRGMKDGMVVNALRNSPEIKDAMEKKRLRQNGNANGCAH
ncbi:MAG: hypothetical protein Q9227_000294 [Pyrenula ochraceoflavens]